MTRISKQARKRSISPKRPRLPSVKTGSKKDALPLGYKPVENAFPEESALLRFIPKMRRSV